MAEKVEEGPKITLWCLANAFGNTIIFIVIASPVVGRPILLARAVPCRPIEVPGTSYVGEGKFVGDDMVLVIWQDMSMAGDILIYMAIHGNIWQEIQVMARYD